MTSRQTDKQDVNVRVGEFSATTKQAVSEARAQLKQAEDAARSHYKAGVAQANADDHSAQALASDNALERFWEKAQAGVEQGSANFHTAVAKRQDAAVQKARLTH